MSLIVETGEGLTNANSYAEVSTANAFYTDRPNTAWSEASADEKAVALIRATDFIDANYIFRSVKTSDDQALENPRFPYTSLHPALVKATIVLAVHMLTYNANVVVTDHEIVSQEKALEGVGSTKVTYRVTGTIDPFPLVTKTLAHIASRRGSGGSTMWMKQ